MTDPLKDTGAQRLIALVIMALFVLSYLMPFFVAIPAGEGGTLIIATSKVIENAVILVIGFYLGSTSGSERKNQAIADQAAALANTQQPVVVADAPVDVKVREPGR